ncbi:MAG: SDR family NAD(P)-dependent oxidoreductase [Halobacteriales archaeon]|nr:SDR family NAD(P)-dependent oxidoreductase [Halobacteriales archaeon]
MDLASSTAIVTGGAGGIGRATARRLAEAGASVAVTDVDEAGGRSTVEAIRDDGGEAMFRRLDVTDHGAFESAFDAVADEFDPVDVLVNNAGVGHPPGWLQETALDDRDDVFRVNIDGVWNGCHVGVSRMAARGAGAIVNVSSLAGLVGAPGLATYSMSKGAVMNFTRSVAAEAGPVGVRVNAVCPGFVETPMVEEYFGSFEDPEAARAETVAQYPLRRLGRPEEVADAIVFLASDAASFVTGHGLTIDGGFSAY